MKNNTITRRSFVTGSVGLMGIAATGCTSLNDSAFSSLPTKPAEPAIPQDYALAYGPKPNEQFPIPAVDLKKVPQRYWRREIDYVSPHPVGTIIVDTTGFYLYLVMPNDRAMRYGVGLGRQGFTWSGRGKIQWKQAWPKWTPPTEMIGRQPELEKYSAANGGMQPGIDNPLGARALYIFQGGKDTLYRIHGSPEYWTIGKAVSSGCVRLMNQDIVDLYDRVKSGSTLIVA
ncbi:L,D-transpeptidase [Ahrensia sp. 13_GOM-1096m]|uniref:L,D-transpeptidase n=1 Tax=Ahrensia sp. 13_GOM-1096m TaxID=1380380 RepID=UPI00047B2210|nr:L,D-transpeptidase [Ahrensia sp. 13_GOM-1096m]